MVILYVICDPCAITKYINTLILVKTEVIMVAFVKYANLCVSGLNCKHVVGVQGVKVHITWEYKF